MCVRQSASDENLFLLTDARIEALDKSLSQLKLFDQTNTDAMWKFVSDIQRDPYLGMYVCKFILYMNSIRIRFEFYVHT